MLRESSMKTSRYSKAALKTTLQLCLGAVVACVLVVAFMNQRREAAEHRYERAEHGIQGARSRLERANEHRALIEKYQRRYQQLIGEGLIVPFDRAVAGDWFEAAIPAMKFGTIDDYVIGKSTPYAGPETAELSAFRVVAHRLDFTATVAHEDEFADLMSTLEKQVPGTTAQEGCSLSRHREASGDTERLAVGCALIWYEFTRERADLAANSGGS
jgi:hypothetical protein